MTSEIEEFDTLDLLILNQKELSDKQIKHKINKCIRKIDHAYKYMKIDMFSDDRRKHFEEKVRGIIIKEFGTKYYKTKNNETLLHLFVSDPDLVYKTSPRLYKIIIDLLLEIGIKPNIIDNQGKNFVMKAIEVGYGPTVIKCFIELGLKYNLNINHRDNDGNTIMGSLLYNCYCYSALLYIYKFLLDKGFNIDNRERYDKSFEETIYYISNILKKEIKEGTALLSHYNKMKFNDTYFKQFHNKENENNDKIEEKVEIKEEIKINDKDLEYLKKYGLIIRNNNVPYSVELDTKTEEQIINSISNKNTILLNYEFPYISNDILYTLPYMIKKYNKDKLNNRLILKTSFKEIINNCSTIGSFKGDFILLMRTCAENKVILVLNDINKIILNNMDEHDKDELKAFIEFYINTKDLILIGISKKECLNKVNEIFSDNIIDINTNEKPKVLKKKM